MMAHYFRDQKRAVETRRCLAIDFPKAKDMAREAHVVGSNANAPKVSITLAN